MISVVVSAYNEESNIEDCLKSAKSIADEIILVDNNSSDKTVQIANKYTHKIFKRPNDPIMLNTNKNYGFSKATGDWIILLDADERVTLDLAKEIRLTINDKQSTKFTGFEVPRKNIIFGKWIQNSIWWPDYNLRVFKNGSGKFPENHVHEKLKVTGQIGKLKNPLIHYNYQTVSQFIRKLDATYTESETENFLKSGKSIFWYDAIRWPINDFVKTFFYQKGYKDGFHGLILSMLQAFYSFVFFVKVWERKEKFADLTPNNFVSELINEFAKAAKEIKYWIYQTLIIENPTKRLFYKIKRKLS